MFAEERKIKIIELLKEKKKITVPELCEYFKVSSATIRGDLNELEKSNLAIRTHGGAILKTKAGFELTSKQKQVSNQKAKIVISHLALNYIEDHDTIILDSGTTTLELAKLLYKRIDLTVVTNDINIASVLDDFEGIEVVVLGGVLRKGFNCTIGNNSHQQLRELSVDKAFMACNSFSMEKGASTPNILHSEVKREMISISSKTFLLVDSTKFGKKSFSQFAPLDKIDIIITDTISKKSKIQLEQDSISVISVVN
ncbi:MAG: DeoR/GlpR transcriptional regulator [Cyclobacteriaceae bacterium]|nr:DeoR/GlpR transcriptional regulator [Cyclobacteriaceae bacterium]